MDAQSRGVVSATCAGTVLAPGIGMSLLVVEDDPINAKLISLILVDAGYSVRIAPSAEAALELLGGYRPRLILLDLVLPLMSGLVFAAQVRRDPRFAATAIVAVSAYAGREIEALAKDAGCATFLRKPLDVLALPRVVAAYLEAP